MFDKQRVHDLVASMKASVEVLLDIICLTKHMPMPKSLQACKPNPNPNSDPNPAPNPSLSLLILILLGDTCEYQMSHWGR